MNNVSKTMKRWLVSVLSVAMLVTSVPVSAYAEELDLMDEAVIKDTVVDKATDEVMLKREISMD